MADPGARIWDLDGNVYIDYRLGYGPSILGYCHREVDAAARAGQEVGSVFALAAERELAVAELIDRGVLCEPDSREPWFISAAHDDSCLEETLAIFEEAVDATLDKRRRTGGDRPEAVRSL